MAYRPGKKQLSTGDFWIDDQVIHEKSSTLGVVIAHNHARGLIRVRWDSDVEEWVPPEEIRLVAERD